jgi:hypothetical protein
MSDPEKVQIARITARQAMVVALITALAGVFGVALQRYGLAEPQPKPEAPQQDAVRFDGIEFQDPDAIKRYRVVLNVDGFPYSYPGNRVWHDVGLKAPEQMFPLKVGASKHIVLIKLRCETESGESIEAETEKGQALSVDSGIANLPVSLNLDGLRAGPVMATVRVEIRRL